MRLLAALPLLLASACLGDESVARYGAAGKVWVLEELDNAPFTARATLEFNGQEEVNGRAPCNGFGARQTAPYPWFKLGPIRATKRACPDLKAEGVFFKALGEMSLAEVSGDVLILSNDAGRSMVFKVGD